MTHGWAGTSLEIDLSRGKIEKRENDPQLLRAFLGGKGTDSKILWDRVPPEVSPLAEDSPLIIGTGVLTGTIVPSANRTTVTCKSPMTSMQSTSVVGGFFGPELKYAGFDAMVISGKSPSPVYLWIKDGQVEIRDASHLWGKDTRQTQQLIRQEMNTDRAQILCIGPAGENKVYAASIEHSTGVSASRGGNAAVMGDKNLKAIAVCGTKDISIANPARLIELCDQILSKTDPVKKVKQAYGWTVTGGLLNLGAPGNFRREVPPEFFQRMISTAPTEVAKEFAEKRSTRQVACYNCGLSCKFATPVPGGGYSYFKCQELAAAQVAARMIDCEVGIKVFNQCERYGLDVMSVSTIIMFVIDLYEKGILTKGDTDGLHLEYENPEVIYSLVEKIARREGIGDVLADGVCQAAQRIGRGAEKYVVHSKKQDALPYDIRGRSWAALSEAVNERGDRTRVDAGLTQMLQSDSPWPKEQREEYIKEGFFQYPKEFEKYFLADWGVMPADYEGFCQFVAYDEELYTISDMTGVCAYWTVFGTYPPFSSRALFADLISCTTGLDLGEAELTEIIRRVNTLVRAYNVREGIRRKDDTIADIFFEPSLRPHQRQLDRDLFNKWVDRFNQIKGRNSDGVPTKETLEELGLDYVRQDLEQRGIATS